MDTLDALDSDRFFVCFGFLLFCLQAGLAFGYFYDGNLFTAFMIIIIIIMETDEGVQLQNLYGLVVQDTNYEIRYHYQNKFFCFV